MAGSHGQGLANHKWEILDCSASDPAWGLHADFHPKVPGCVRGQLLLHTPANPSPGELGHRARIVSKASAGSRSPPRGGISRTIA